MRHGCGDTCGGRLTRLLIRCVHRDDIEMRRLVWADEASQGEQPLEQVRPRGVCAALSPVLCVLRSHSFSVLVQEFVIPARPLHLRRKVNNASPSFCIFVATVLALFIFWKALYAA